MKGQKLISRDLTGSVMEESMLPTEADRQKKKKSHNHSSNMKMHKAI